MKLNNRQIVTLNHLLIKRNMLTHKGEFNFLSFDTVGDAIVEVTSDYVPTFWVKVRRSGGYEDIPRALEGGPSNHEGEKVATGPRDHRAELQGPLASALAKRAQVGRDAAGNGHTEKTGSDPDYGISI